MISISIESKRFNLSMDLHQKYTVIIGDSGRGKSWFTKIVEESNIAYKISISDLSYKLSVLSSDWYNVMDSVAVNNEKRIFIIDDFDFIITDEFSELYRKCRDCYFIIINRLGVYNISGVYEFKFNGSNYYLDKLINI